MSSSEPNAVERAIAENPVAQHAASFADSIEPLDGVDYSWVTVVAKGRYDALIKAFDDLDAKAAALVGYLGSSTGLISLGTLFTVINATVSPWVGVATIPSIALAAGALICAARARKTENIFPPPTAETLITIANSFNSNKEKAQAVMAAQWDICTALLRPAVQVKGEAVDCANRLFALAVISLSLPLLVQLCIRIF